MNVFEFNPYVRLSQRSVLRPYVKLNRRVILDYEIIFVQGGSATLNIENKQYHNYGKEYFDTLFQELKKFDTVLV